MKKKLIKGISVFALALAMTSCSITMPVTATSNAVGSKVGKSSATVVLGFAFNEDASIRTAAKQGGISKISTVDIKVKNVLGLIVTYETIITGE
ncbi:TRL-like family protein [Kordia jejudonensis]|uniref:TRL-like family protein n=1 Tax=Kordia jejudonensis TaxID=1348245 RepID=UPI0006992960|nr:TRL-like family protein [Kordia jejudonensis]